MKHKIWPNHLIGAVFAFMLSVSAVGSLVTGHELPVESLMRIYLLCGLFAVISSLLFRFRYGGWGMIILFALTLYLLCRKEILWQQVQQLSFILTSYYHEVYGWPILGSAAAEDVSLPLILWAALAAVCVNWYICRFKHIVVAFVPAVVPLVLCLITNDRVPAGIYLYLMILGLSLLLLTDWTRKKNPSQSTKLVFRSLMPIAAALAMIFALNPRDEYVNHAGELQKEVVAWVQELLDRTESSVSDTPVATPVSDRLNLRNVGPKSRRSHSVMRINAPVSGKQYLRGRDYDRYTGTGWEATSGRSEVFPSSRNSAGKLTIVTYGVRNVLYVPYYAKEEIHLVGGGWENEENLQRYSYYVSTKPSALSDVPADRYTRLPDDTRQWAEELLQEIIGGSLSEDEMVRRIQNYVTHSAVYDLDTSRMDVQYSDFASWFLEESETGYCVHFATAATVLLRAAGIPARYVEGYMVNCNAGEETIVSSMDAHAWAEYFDTASGAWCVLEATPADPEDEETEPSDTIPETETDPEETQTETQSSDTEPSDGEDLPTKPQTGQDGDSPGNTAGKDEEKQPFRIPGWVKAVFKWLLVISCIPIQAYARIYWKRILWNRGRPNERTITRWKQTHSLAKLLKQQYPEKLDNLAQKAIFSQHRIQPEELQQYEEYRLSLIAEVNGKPWYQKCLFRWILAIG